MLNNCTIFVEIVDGVFFRFSSLAHYCSLGCSTYYDLMLRQVEKRMNKFKSEHISFSPSRSNSFLDQILYLKLFTQAWWNVFYWIVFRLCAHAKFFRFDHSNSLLFAYMSIWFFLSLFNHNVPISLYFIQSSNRLNQYEHSKGAHQSNEGKRRRSRKKPNRDFACLYLKGIFSFSSILLWYWKCCFDFHVLLFGVLFH